MDYKLLIILMVILLLIILTYHEICQLRSEYKSTYNFIKKELTDTNSGMVQHLQNNMDSCVSRIKNISAENLNQLKKINIINNQPINRIANHFTETDETDSGGRRKYDIFKNNRDSEYYQSNSDEMSDTSVESAEIDVENDINSHNIVINIDTNTNTSPEIGKMDIIVQPTNVSLVSTIGVEGENTSRIELLSTESSINNDLEQDSELELILDDDQEKQSIQDDQSDQDVQDDQSDQDVQGDQSDQDEQNVQDDDLETDFSVSEEEEDNDQNVERTNHDEVSELEKILQKSMFGGGTQSIDESIISIETAMSDLTEVNDQVKTMTVDDLDSESEYTLKELKKYASGLNIKQSYKDENGKRKQRNKSQLYEMIKTTLDAKNDVILEE